MSQVLDFTFLKKGVSLNCTDNQGIVNLSLFIHLNTKKIVLENLHTSIYKDYHRIQLDWSLTFSLLYKSLAVSISFQIKSNMFNLHC